jgi:hypothetical protein
MLALKDATTKRKYLYDVCEVSGCTLKQNDTYSTNENKRIHLCKTHYDQIANEVLW